MKSIFLSLLLSGLALTGCATTSKPLENVDLKWQATTDLKDLTALNLASLNSSVTLAKLKDSRTVEPLNKIGENQEAKPVRTVTTNSDVADFVTTGLGNTLHKAGLNTVATGGAYTLNGEITDFFVTETNVYKTSLVVIFTLSKGNKVVWKGTVMGKNTKFGRSYKLENYYEALSDSVIDLATELAKNDGFTSKLK